MILSEARVAINRKVGARVPECLLEVCKPVCDKIVQGPKDIETRKTVLDANPHGNTI